MPAEANSTGPFRKTWESPPGVAGWFATVNNQPLGRRFMITAFIFFVLGGVIALLMRVQLTVSQNDFLGPQLYNQLFTMHGSTMMYLFAVPFLEGLALYLLPLVIGSRDVAFPRLTAFSYWTYLFGGVIFYASFLFGAVPDAGWFAYTPLSGPKYSGLGVDFWLIGLAMVEIGGIAAGAEIVVTVLKLRAPGMAINRMPLFAWAMLVTGIMVIFAFTVLLMATLLLEMDRAIGTRFFDPENGGNTLLWQHLFWFFGHPEVYIIFIPATGIVSMIVPVFARRPIAAYTLIAVAIVITGFVSFGLWVHHMFTTGLPLLAMSFFTAASLMIGVASGIQVFAWIATLWGSRPQFKTPLLFVLGFVFLFVLGGITGVMIAVVSFDWQVHDTYFIVAHFHYVLIGGAVFPIFAGLHYWIPKITGRLLDETLGQWTFWLSFIGFNAAFFPMHIMGFLGMPRRVYTYPRELGLDGHNMVSTVGAFVLGLGFMLFVVNLFLSLRKGAAAGANPWQADSLEWSVSSPPPIYGFLSPPIVQDRNPLWTGGSGPGQFHVAPATRNCPATDPAMERASAALTGAPEGWRATLATDPMTAEPQSIQYLPGPSLFPFLAAAGLVVASLGMLAKLYLLAPFGAAFTVAVLTAWLWPGKKRLELLRASTLEERSGLPIFTAGSRSTAWWGMLCLIATVATAFGALFYSYFYLRLFSEAWPQGNLPRPDAGWPLLALIILIASAGPLFWARCSFRRGTKRGVQAGLAGGLLLGVTFLVVQLTALGRVEFTPQTNAYASLFHVILWLLLLVTTTGLALLAAALIWVRRHSGESGEFINLPLQITNMFWHFVIVAGVFVFAVVYASPHLL